MNFIQYKPTQIDWTRAYVQSMGKESFYAYANRIFLAMSKIDYGCEFVIAKHVLPERYDLFVKCACWWIELSPGWYMSDDYSIVKRDPFVDPTHHHRGKKKLKK